MVIKKAIKKILPKRVVNFIKIKRSKNQYLGQPIEDVFTVIKNSNRWKSTESLSGRGSELNNVTELIKGIEFFIKQYNIKSILDIPCGDFNWMKTINLNNAEYIGADIVKSLIDNNNKLYADRNIKFFHMDLTIDDLPKVDVIFCRDCLVHLSFKDIYKALINIKRSESKYLMTTSFINANYNKDIITGTWRVLNLQKAPFFFSRPILTINENYAGKSGKYPDKSVCLWELNKIKIAFHLKLFYWFT